MWGEDDLQVELQYVTAEALDGSGDRNEDILDGFARIPAHVVYRDFINETVMLNLETGTYHGLNRTAGLMLTMLDSSATVREAASRLVAEYGWDPAVVENDIVTLCRTLADTGLVQLGAPAESAA